MDKVSYALGIGIGRQLADMGANDIVTEDFAAAMKDVLTGAQLQIDETEAQAMVQEYLQRKGEERLKNVKAEGEAFLADNAKKEGIVTLPSGLQYQVLQEGNGKSPKATDQVKCHYEGTLINGKVFDSSYRRGEPATFPLNGVIAGWTEGLQLMKEGAKYRFFIPFNLAYGTRGAGQDIPPYATLIFDVELIEVK
ncbi:MAG: FKBP-type peptidyl-prolyl cis-trans isomerase [Prevotella sp.]|uniref:FKBP-type peptidyl-prolyl cis-trans isomerase n=1 Tax=Prevotella sp. P3-122 TaxID=2024223 RepID=UPI000B96433A|nr:FKBP-type peptidyl-prolyl cis-trans isomerase [Prevotella sp. P3-122]MCI6463476.1 FKBP-type peptidyl-prolyl cis-trans isomerase [Prevotella sp.]MCI6500123.1 FKBP-type peptidyl-prolyl cis-trans isomerase [Prevotella sp.]MCI7361592.1 FKBP-type peptidyl-prolyl cis-trans isomerase [Prevotella sp.]MCI7686835.1 FKBP-type peptidyl-prolyl cis-trans isomerase [Prevotella sp.]MDD6671510.1 FKBP-type peptidyl-prolyl cis-trans isomerase [Prevotella sp.]